MAGQGASAPPPRSGSAYRAGHLHHQTPDAEDADALCALWRARARPLPSPPGAARLTEPDMRITRHRTRKPPGAEAADALFALWRARARPLRPGAARLTEPDTCASPAAGRRSRRRAFALWRARARPLRPERLGLPSRIPASPDAGRGRRRRALRAMAGQGASAPPTPRSGSAYRAGHPRIKRRRTRKPPTRFSRYGRPGRVRSPRSGSAHRAGSEMRRGPVPGGI